MCEPRTRLAQELHAIKYRSPGESFKEAQNRFASALADNPEEFYALRDILVNQRFMGGGRTQQAVGSPRHTTAFNCFVSGVVEDSFDSIMDNAKKAGQTMRKGGGIGYDFSRLRPKGSLIKTLGSNSSGAISFMSIFDSICKTIASSGHRRGAQMGVLRVDHPDIEAFIHAKQNTTELTAFNISVGVTDEFIKAVINKTNFDLKFEGKVTGSLYAPALWETLMRSTWDWAEPGVLFIDRINEMNNLHYCEEIEATNPCGEQPLPPHGACLLGSFNLTKYLVKQTTGYDFDYEQFRKDIPHVVRAMDNIHDETIFPLPEQKAESQAKRRMGLGVTGLANCIETIGYVYGSEEFLQIAECIFAALRDEVYNASIDLAKEKGSFPMFNSAEYGNSRFVRTLPKAIRAGIQEHGIRNSHLLSFAPTGTISLTADNVSGGIEPVFSHQYDRLIQLEDGAITEVVKDYAYNFYGVKGKTAGECTAADHLNVLTLATKYVDSAVSKTINVSPDMPWDEFKDIYMTAWKAGCKGCTTFNSGGKRFGILTESKDEPKACYIDEQSGQKECS